MDENFTLMDELFVLWMKLNNDGWKLNNEKVKVWLRGTTNNITLSFY